MMKDFLAEETDDSQLTLKRIGKANNPGQPELAQNPCPLEGESYCD